MPDFTCPAPDGDAQYNAESDAMPACDGGYRHDGETWVRCEQCHRACIADGRVCGATTCPVEDAPLCVVCGVRSADLLDDGLVPYCARDYDAIVRAEEARAEREVGYRTGHCAVSDREVLS